MPLDVLVEMINSSLEFCVVKCSPRQPKKRQSRKHPWTPEMKPIVRLIKEIHHRIKNNKNEEIPHDVLALKAAKRLLRKEPI